MSVRVISLPIVICVLALFSTQLFAQSVARRQANATPQSQGQSASLPPNANSLEAVANEIDLRRKSLQTLNTRLREISEKLLAPDAKQGDGSNDKQNRITIQLGSVRPRRRSCRNLAETASRIDRKRDFVQKPHGAD